jgi:ATP-binding cassette subfamily C protein
MLSRRPARFASEHGSSRMLQAEAARRNAEVLRAMGFGGRMAGIWAEANAKYIESHRRASDIAGGLGSISKVLRMMLQSAVLGVGAYLVVRGEATAGIIIASAILTSRALAPVELTIANWRGFLSARQSWHRLSKLLENIPKTATLLALPKPTETLSVEAASTVPPGDRKLVVNDVSFSLTKGQVLGIVGPSASGKSSLVRLIVGVWAPVRGQVRLDNAALDQWHPEALGRHIGYLPQDIELFGGTVAENICRFDRQADAEAIIAAARAAGVHDMILRLPEGYETQIGEGGAVLSAGQRQRVALARALYGDPFLVVLDEPNSNLDSDGERALAEALAAMRARGGIAIVVAHRANVLASTDMILVMGAGQMRAFGSRDEILARAQGRPLPAAAPTPLKVVRDGSQA